MYKGFLGGVVLILHKQFQKFECYEELIVISFVYGVFESGERVCHCSFFLSTCFFELGSCPFADAIIPPIERDVNRFCKKNLKIFEKNFFGVGHVGGFCKMIPTKTVERCYNPDNKY